MPDTQILIVLDAVRYDTYTSIEHDNLPNNVLKAYSPACWTLGSFFTYFTGLSPIRAKHFPFVPDEWNQIDWLPKALKDEGYWTEFYTESAWMYLHEDVFGKGFVRSDIRLGSHLFSDFVDRWMPLTQDPQFSVFHVLETHNPTFDGSSEHQLVKDKEHNEELVRDALKYVDKEFGRLLEKVEDGTVVTVTADHGNAFGENGSWGHSPRASMAKENILGDTFRLNGMPEKVFEIPYAVGRMEDGEMNWFDPDVYRMDDDDDNVLKLPD